MIVEVHNKSKKHTVEFYSTIRKLPIRRFQKFNKFEMVASDVGASVDDLLKRLSRASGYIGNNDAKSAVQELNNLVNTVHHAMEEYSPKHQALAIMVKSIDGVECVGFEEDDLQQVLDKLDSIGFDQETAETTTTDLKKN